MTNREKLAMQVWLQRRWERAIKAKQKAIDSNTYVNGGPGHRDGGGIVKLEGTYNAYRADGGSDKSNHMGRNLHIAASHGHGATISTAGNNQAHENRMPYTVINRWKRTA